MCGDNNNCVPFGCKVGDALEMLGPAIIWPVLITVFITGVIAGVIFCKVLSKKTMREPLQNKDESP